MKNWLSLLVRPETSLEEAIATLDSGGARIVMVADEQRRLLGTVTDGDIRRALLRKLPLDVAVNEVMWRKPVTGHPSWSRERMRSVLEQHKLLQLPIVDSEGVVVGLETLQEVVHREQRDNPVFLMAGGFGRRLHPLTESCPKPMLRVGDKPILQIILESFIEAGFHRFFISTHYLPEMIKSHFGDGSDWGVSLSYVDESVPLGTGGALGLLPKDQIDAPVIVMNGDLLTRIDFRSLLDFHVKQGGIATMCVREYQHQVPYGVVESNGPRVVSFVEKPTHRYFINAGIYVLSPALVKGVAPQTRIDMPDVLDAAMKAGESVCVFPVHEYWLDIGRMEDFERAQEQLNGGGS